MLNGNGMAPKVVLVGGSLGGLFKAIALRSLGCEVEVFEKSSGLMKDRGAGIVFQQEVADFLSRYEVTPLDAVVVPVRTRRYLEANGSVAQEGPMPHGRVCLTGDAAFVPRPHTAASTAKAAANALTLADCLASSGGDVMETLRRWEPDQLEL